MGLWIGIAILVLTLIVSYFVLMIEASMDVRGDRMPTVTFVILGTGTLSSFLCILTHYLPLHW